VSAPCCAINAGEGVVRRPDFIARQSGCPSGLLGRLIGYIMSAETAAANGQALTALDLKTGDHVLEVGFGHGRTIERAASSFALGFVAGIDRSEEMARMAARRCRQLAAGGKVGLTIGDSDDLPFSDRRFDKVLSVHTVYFWSDPLRHLREIRRVLRDGGRFVLACRSKSDKKAEHFPETVYTFYTAAEISRLLEASGFDSVEVSHGRGEIIIATAHRPLSAT
jgi:ubiquinone/menaquinone biosynthesis C-methylase UbiE